MITRYCSFIILWRIISKSFLITSEITSCL
uniref:Uncharacterized protein n=1 Tax=CrAss-like virus sp. ctYsL76 TaxID=2826826 RepID=A0A8S5QMJ6_9CAUD|nr:MAG TPA: hypothetical protein [CrAss-like virus sp. ctYsL76]